MPDFDDSVKQELLDTDDEFSGLWAEHQGCEERLMELTQKSLLSQDDELEEKRIKRHKLFLKDRMEAIVRERRTASATA
jgi:uncharacterized protein YdcH (DUF465 family)